MRYVTPSCNITQGASEATQLTFVNGQMYKNNQPVASVSLASALSDFIDFIEQFHAPILVGHNIKRYDCIILYHSLKYIKMWSHFCSIIQGFMDTLFVCKDLFPGQPSYKQVDIIFNVMGLTYGAHDAAEDTASLYKLVESYMSTEAVIAKHVFSKAIVEIDVQFSKFKMSFDDIVKAKKMSAGTAGKLARSGLNMQHLKLANERSPSDGLFSLLTEMVKGKPRITKSKKIIDSIKSYFEM